METNKIEQLKEQSWYQEADDITKIAMQAFTHSIADQSKRDTVKEMYELNPTAWLENYAQYKGIDLNT